MIIASEKPNTFGIFVVVFFFLFLSSQLHVHLSRNKVLQSSCLVV